METDPNKIIRVHIWVKGRVQGVGFRAMWNITPCRSGCLAGCGISVGIGWRQLPKANRKSTVYRDGQARSPRFKGGRAQVEYEEPTGQLEGFTVKRSM
jgi:hypothetical protein